MRFIKILCLLTYSNLLLAQIDVKKEFELAAKQYEGMLASHPDLTQFPQSTKLRCFGRCYCGIGLV